MLAIGEPRSSFLYSTHTYIWCSVHLYCPDGWMRSSCHPPTSLQWLLYLLHWHTPVINRKCTKVVLKQFSCWFHSIFKIENFITKFNDRNKDETKWYKKTKNKQPNKTEKQNNFKYQRPSSTEFTSKDLLQFEIAYSDLFILLTFQITRVHGHSTYFNTF